MPAEAGATRRQRLRSLLEGGEHGFEELRRALLVSVRTLEEELRHVERSARRGAERLRVTPARCSACGFTFRGRETRHFHAPGRCPRCRGERIDEPRFRLASAGEEGAVACERGAATPAEPGE